LSKKKKKKQRREGRPLPAPEARMEGAEEKPSGGAKSKKGFSLKHWWRERKRKKEEKKKALYVERRAFLFFGKKKMRKKKGIIREYVEAFLVALVLAMVIRTFIVQAFMIPSGSMEDTLLVGDYVLVSKFAYDFWEPQRGDVIVFKYPLQDNTMNPWIWTKELFMKLGGVPTPPRMDYIKRIIGLPGETLELKDGVVYINNEPLDEPYLKEPPNLNISLNKHFGPITIPEDSYFMMGDNRNESKDSRYWGVLPKDLIKGKAIIIYWSWAHSSCPTYFPAPNGGMVECGGNLQEIDAKEAALYLSPEAMQKTEKFYQCENPKCRSIHRYWWDVIPKPFYEFWARIRWSRLGDLVK
jgi:signal peptidase I